VRFERVAIAALGHEVPPAVLSSSAIEDRLAPLYQRIGLVPGRLEMMTGVRERRFWPDAEAARPSASATRAGARALAAVPSIARERIGVLVHAAVSRDFLEPATAALVHDALGLSPEAEFYDLSNACLGVATAMMNLGALIDAGRIEAGLIVAGENGAPLTETTIAELLSDPSVTRQSIKPALASLTIGSGAAAVLLARADLAPPGSPRLLGGVVRAASRHHRLCRGDSTGGGGLTMRTDAEALLEAGVELAKETWPRFVQELEPEIPARPRAFTHQIGRAHTQAMFAALDLDPAASFFTYDRLGNVGSVSLPITLCLASEAGRIARGETIALLGIGSGLSTAMLGVRW
jgi:3-oxoacyl-[acyl-carrier-protein] synthase-3